MQLLVNSMMSSCKVFNEICKPFVSTPYNHQSHKYTHNKSINYSMLLISNAGVCNVLFVIYTVGQTSILTLSAS